MLTSPSEKEFSFFFSTPTNIHLAVKQVLNHHTVRCITDKRWPCSAAVLSWSLIHRRTLRHTGVNRRVYLFMCLICLGHEGDKGEEMTNDSRTNLHKALTLCMTETDCMIFLGLSYHISADPGSMLPKKIIQEITDDPSSA